MLLQTAGFMAQIPSPVTWYPKSYCVIDIRGEQKKSKPKNHTEKAVNRMKFF